MGVSAELLARTQVLGELSARETAGLTGVMEHGGQKSQLALISVPAHSYAGVLG